VKFILQLSHHYPSHERGSIMGIQNLPPVLPQQPVQLPAQPQQQPQAMAPLPQQNMVPDFPPGMQRPTDGAHLQFGCSKTREAASRDTVSFSGMTIGRWNPPGQQAQPAPNQPGQNANNNVANQQGAQPGQPLNPAAGAQPQNNQPPAGQAPQGNAPGAQAQNQQQPPQFAGRVKLNALATLKKLLGKNQPVRK
jgi:hypothetical protein